MWPQGPQENWNNKSGAQFQGAHLQSQSRTRVNFWLRVLWTNEKQYGRNNGYLNTSCNPMCFLAFCVLPGVMWLLLVTWLGWEAEAMGTTHVSEEGKVLGVLENRPIVSSVHDVYFWNMYSLDIAFFLSEDLMTMWKMPLIKKVYLATQVLPLRTKQEQRHFLYKTNVLC